MPGEAYRKEEEWFLAGIKVVGSETARRGEGVEQRYRLKCWEFSGGCSKNRDVPKIFPLCPRIVIKILFSFEIMYYSIRVIVLKDINTGFIIMHYNESFVNNNNI